MIHYDIVIVVFELGYEFISLEFKWINNRVICLIIYFPHWGF
jgi:hypothetical protein